MVFFAKGLDKWWLRVYICGIKHRAVETLQSILRDFSACPEARMWAGDRSIEEIVATCHRGDWLLWLAEKVYVEKRLLVLAGGLCANTVRHLMRDERSLKAVDVAIAFGRGEAGEAELGAAREAAWSAARDAAEDDLVDDAEDIAWAAAEVAAWAASADYEGDIAWAAAGDELHHKTADIAREVLGEQLILKVNEMLK